MDRIEQNHPDMVKCRALIWRSKHRQLYKFIGQTKSEEKYSPQQIADIIDEIVAGGNTSAGSSQSGNPEEIPDSDVEEDEEAGMSQKHTPGKNGSVRSISAPLSQGARPLCAEDLIVETYVVHFGQKKENPVNFMHFYDKDAPERGEWVGKRVAESAYEEEMPARFEARGVRVFLKRTEAKKSAWDGFKKWAKNNKQTLSNPPATGDEDE
mmetsp:Transcript_15146/g.36626  ORF Transcript_15146/g.36626 Transcript_15146/m.36626 type:complete len:210 (+) Transcript_15146:35-664(+)